MLHTAACGVVGYYGVQALAEREQEWCYHQVSVAVTTSYKHYSYVIFSAGPTIITAELHGCPSDAKNKLLFAAGTRIQHRDPSHQTYMIGVGVTTQQQRATWYVTLCSMSPKCPRQDQKWTKARLFVWYWIAPVWSVGGIFHGISFHPRN